MAKSHEKALNALKHGIFRQFCPPTDRSPFALLAEKSVRGHHGQVLAADVMRAETQTARCRSSVHDQIRAIEALLYTTASHPDDPGTKIDCALRQLTRLIRYQNNSLTALRKGRIAILNAVEGLNPIKS